MNLSMCSICNQELPPGLDFESGDLSFWTAEGEAFLKQPIRGDRFITSQVKPGLISVGGDYWDGPYPVGHQGDYWISTEDHLTGTLTSDVFILILYPSLRVVKKER